MDSADRVFSPQNNQACKTIKVDAVWLKGYTGSGIKIAILDSGLDSDPLYSDLPNSFQKKDYSAYPTLDEDIENKFTGHGTHVTASALGRGILSSGNNDSYNGAGAYKGMAPSADLAFLKIGNDVNGSASYTAIDAAMTAAVSTYHADVITMSYGGWGTYHDGSEAMDQKVDWSFDQGVPVFISAGNEADKARHCSGTVPANGETDYIQIDVTSAATNSIKLKFNLVWYDGIDVNHDELTIKYYDVSKVELVYLTKSIPTESLRGTESQLSNYNQFVPAGNSTYYLKVVNSSASSRSFHVYEDWNQGKVKIVSCPDPNCIVPDPNYTVSSPSTADHAFSVGAFTSRTNWKDSAGNTWTNGNTLNAISHFSSRGASLKKRPVHDTG